MRGRQIIGRADNTENNIGAETETELITLHRIFIELRKMIDLCQFDVFTYAQPEHVQTQFCNSQNRQPGRFYCRF